ncbi:MAG: hypothetical protein VR65_27295 [Desulfobulbaceae bacterium BRH_c16a]|nr:MAG: hypothetical protein VR65_27295 [Desulfobulbaceae bacterium BRH_c16a]
MVHMVCAVVLAEKRSSRVGDGRLVAIQLLLKAAREPWVPPREVSWVVNLETGMLLVQDSF